MLPPEPRLPGAAGYIEQGRYFVVHAPRQTGKTTTLMAIARDLTAEGRHVTLLVSCERAEAAGDDHGAAAGAILAAIAQEAVVQGLPPELMPPSPWPEAEAESRLHSGLAAWARKSPLPIVLFMDEIDALRGNSLISVLRQLRDGFRSRPGSFPASVVLCGLRDVRDYRVASGADLERLGTSSPFNVSVKSLRIKDFTREQVAALYGQHTAETGQEFTPAAVERVFGYTQGQPWLVNALAWEIIGEIPIKPPEPITVPHVDQAKERLILARATHLDSLARLREERVRKVIEPLIAGTIPEADPAYDDDVAYVRDLGLINEGRPIAIANPIYREVIVRVLGDRTADVVTAEPRSFVLPDGRLDFPKLLAEFAAFWRAHGEILVRGEAYHEVAPQLVFMAFLQRIVNGGGLIEREYGVGRGRIDLLVRKQYAGADGKTAVQQEAIELKVRRQHQRDPLKEGLDQLDEYLSRLGLHSGTLLIFDRRPHTVRTQPDPEISHVRTPGGREVTLLRA